MFEQDVNQNRATTPNLHLEERVGLNSSSSGTDQVALEEAWRFAGEYLGQLLRRIAADQARCTDFIGCQRPEESVMGLTGRSGSFSERDPSMHSRAGDRRAAPEAASDCRTLQPERHSRTAQERRNRPRVDRELMFTCKSRHSHAQAGGPLSPCNAPLASAFPGMRGSSSPVSGSKSHPDRELRALPRPITLVPSSLRLGTASRRVSGSGRTASRVTMSASP